MKLTLTVMCTIFMIQSLLFGWVFTFRDDGFTRGIDTTITENEQGSDNKAMEDVAGLLDLRNSDE